MRATLSMGLVLLLAAACRTPSLHEPPVDAAPVPAPPDLAPVDTAQPPTHHNSCGGTAMLAHEQGEACGPCGWWICDTTGEAVVCTDAAPLNACGTCGPPPLEICNGVDDDCDGVVDPGCPHIVEHAAPGTQDNRVRILGERLAIESTGSADQPPKTRLVALATMSPPALATFAGITNVEGTSAYLVTSGPLRAYDIENATAIDGPVITAVAPVVDGDEVLFLNGHDIRSWHVGADTTEVVFTIAGATPTGLAVSGRSIAYTDSSGLLSLYDRDAKTQTKIAPELGGPNAHPVLDGTWLVWEHGTSNMVDIYAYQLETQTTTRIDLGTDNHGLNPRIAAGRVCFKGYGRDAWGIYVYDLAAAQLSRLTVSGDSCDLDAKHLVWTSGYYVYYYDL